MLLFKMRKIAQNNFLLLKILVKGTIESILPLKRRDLEIHLVSLSLDQKVFDKKKEKLINLKQGIFLKFKIYEWRRGGVRSTNEVSLKLIYFKLKKMYLPAFSLYGFEVLEDSFRYVLPFKVLSQRHLMQVYTKL